MQDKYLYFCRVSALDGAAGAVTNTKPKQPMKDTIVFLRKNIEKANQFTARLSDTTTIAIPVGVPMNIYDLLVDTESVGYNDIRASDVFDGKHCRINAIINQAGCSYDIQYTKYQVVPIRTTYTDLYIWDVMAGSGTFPPSEYFVRCRVILNVKTGEVRVHTSDSYTAGVMMQFRFK